MPEVSLLGPYTLGLMHSEVGRKGILAALKEKKKGLKLIERGHVNRGQTKFGIPKKHRFGGFEKKNLEGKKPANTKSKSQDFA